MQELAAVPYAFRWLLTFALAALVIALSLVPARGRNSRSALGRLVAATPPPMQKAMHVVFYALLAALLSWSLNSAVAPTTRLAIVLGVTTSTGAALEYVQTRIPGRSGTAKDVVLNAVGGCLGLALAHVMP